VTAHVITSRVLPVSAFGFHLSTVARIPGHRNGIDGFRDLL
jgi:hypothetical protein